MRKFLFDPIWKLFLNTHISSAINAPGLKEEQTSHVWSQSKGGYIGFAESGYTMRSKKQDPFINVHPSSQASVAPQPPMVQISVSKSSSIPQIRSFGGANWRVPLMSMKQSRWRKRVPFGHAEPSHSLHWVQRLHSIQKAIC